MGNPLTGLWGWATGEWHNLVGGAIRAGQDLRDVIDLESFERAVNESLYYLAQIIEASTTLIATSDADTVQIGRDIGVLHYRALSFLRFVYIPRSASLAYREAVAESVRLYFRLDSILTRRIAVEHQRMEFRVLQEELARLVEVADVWARLHTEIAIERNARITEVAAVAEQLTDLIALTRQQILTFVDQVRQQLQQQITLLSQYAHSIPGLVDKAAAGGYDPTLQAHTSAVQRVLDVAVAHDPLVSQVVGRLVTLLVDLAEVEDPVLRLAAQFILRELVDRFGVDTALGALLRDLLGPVLGGGPPKTLAAVAAQVGDRLNASEDGLAHLAPLAQEADALHEMGTLAFDAALLGYLAAAVADPVAAADDTAAALDTVVTPLLAPIRGLLGVP